MCHRFQSYSHSPCTNIISTNLIRVYHISVWWQWGQNPNSSHIITPNAAVYTSTNRVSIHWLRIICTHITVASFSYAQIIKFIWQRALTRFSVNLLNCGAQLYSSINYQTFPALVFVGYDYMSIYNDYFHVNLIQYSDDGTASYIPYADCNTLIDENELEEIFVEFKNSNPLR